ncbi:reverse transcriptase domain-containing protein [Tanacetum coccineum]
MCGAVEGMFMGYMISPEGIKPFPKKTEAVLQLPSPRTIKEVQSLNGKLASLNKFLSNSAERTILQATKAAPVRATPVGSTQAKEGTDCIYGPELNYTPMEKFVLSLVFADKRLRRTITKIERRAGRTQYHLPAKDTLFTDGSSCVDGYGVGLILTSPEGTEFTYALRFQFTASNNKAEYEALITGLWIAYARRTTVRGSQIHVAGILLANHAPGRTRDDTHMQRLSNTSSCAKKPPTAAISNHGPVAKRKPWRQSQAISDNPFKDWCDKLNITQRFALVKHPQSNRLVERANRCLGEGIKARLGEGNKNWIEELPHVIWAHHTIVKSSHGDTSFSLTYGTEAVILAEIGMPTYRTAAVDAVHNDEELRLNLDLLVERHKRATIRESKTKLKMVKYYNARVRGVTFRPGDFVYRSNDASHAVEGGKLSPKWEGPYEVTEALGDGAYKQRSTDETFLLRMWNIANLKKCYL